MPSVAIIYDEQLTGWEETRFAMKRAMESAGLVPRWQEWRRGVPGCPTHQAYSKVVVLADGKDVTTDFANLADCCIPPWQPPLKAHVEALQCELDGLSTDQLEKRRSRARRGGWLGNLPAILVALMPKFTCPLCFPLYGSVLSLLGLGFLRQPRYMFWLTATVLSFALVNLAFQGRRRADYRPLLIGTIGAAGFLTGKFALDQTVVTYVGLFVFMVGCFWVSFSLPERFLRLCRSFRPAPVALTPQESR